MRSISSYTHDLRHLIALVEGASLEFPFETPAVVRLTEYAVPLRYDELLDAVPLHRDGAVKLVGDVGEWASAMLDAFSE